MSAKLLLRRKSASIDIDAAADYYDREAGPDVALRFVDAIEAAVQAMSTGRAPPHPHGASD